MKNIFNSSVRKSLIFVVLFTLSFCSLSAYGEPPVVRSQLHGYSMYPTIQSGDFVVYRSTSFSDLQVGDIVVFQDNFTGERVCHRIVELDNNRAKSKGDNNRFRDRGFISNNNLIGKVTHIGGKSV